MFPRSNGVTKQYVAHERPLGLLMKVRHMPIGMTWTVQYSDTFRPKRDCISVPQPAIRRERLSAKTETLALYGKASYEMFVVLMRSLDSSSVGGSEFRCTTRMV